MPCSRKTSAYTRRRSTTSMSTKSQAMTPWACAARNSRHVGPTLRGAGSIPAAVRISQTVVAPIGCPRRTNSPGYVGNPSVGCPRANRNTTALTTLAVGGLPGTVRHRLKSHLRATSRRYQASRVPGVTGNTRAHCSRWISEDSAANRTRSAGWYRTGRASCLRSTAFSYRSTSNSASLAASRRSSTAGTASRLLATRYTSETMIQTAFQPSGMARVPPPTSSDDFPNGTGRIVPSKIFSKPEDTPERARQWPIAGSGPPVTVGFVHPPGEATGSRRSPGRSG